MGQSRSATLPVNALGGLGLKSDAEDGRKLLADVVDRVRAARPDLKLTIDPVENRGFEYHTGVTFTFFAKGVRGELGSGGRYQTKGEPATGFTLFMDTVLRAVKAPEPRRRVYLPAATPENIGAGLRAEGWTTIAGLNEGADARAEARRLECSHVFIDGKAREIKTGKKKKD